MEFNYIGLFIATLIFLLTPGVGVAILISRTLTSGLIVSFIMGSGMILGDLTYAIFVLSAFSSFSDLIVPYLWYVRIFGVVYLFYIGIQQWNKKSIKIEKQKINKSLIKDFILGYAISFTNPKVIAFYIGFLPLFVPLELLDFNSIVLSSITIWVASMTGLLIIIWVAHKLQRLLSVDKTAIIVNRILGGLIMGLAVLLII